MPSLASQARKRDSAGRPTPLDVCKTRSPDSATQLKHNPRTIFFFSLLHRSLHPPSSSTLPIRPPRRLHLPPLPQRPERPNTPPDCPSPSLRLKRVGPLTHTSLARSRNMRPRRQCAQAVHGEDVRGEEDELARGDGAYWARASRPKRERKYSQLVEAGRGGRPAGEGWMGVEGARGEGGGEVGCQMAPSTSRMGVSWGSRKKGGKVLIASRILQFVSLKLVKPMESRGGGGCYSTLNVIHLSSPACSSPVSCCRPRTLSVRPSYPLPSLTRATMFRRVAVRCR